MNIQHHSHDIISEVNKITRQKISDVVVKEIILWIDNHLDDELTVKNISLKSGYSRFHLMRMFRDYTGIPLALYIKRKRLEKAKELLIKTNYKIMEIAVTTGFSTQQAFSRIFRQHFSCSPSELRKKVKCNQPNTL